MTTLPQHLFTRVDWYNSAPDERGRCSKIASADVGPYGEIPYGGQGGTRVHATGKPPHPDFGQWQTGISLSKASRTIVIDVDDYEEYKLSNLEVSLPVEEATSFRITGEGKLKLHFVVVVPVELLPLWPKQGSTPWGDIKSNGFSYIAGVHYSGSEYKATANDLITADEDLMRAIASEPRAQVTGSSSGTAAGAWAEEGYAYPDGAKWTRGVADTASMVSQGLLDADIRALMTGILARSENYTGHGEEVAGWISSARGKFALAEGESWSDQLAAEHHAQLRYLFGDEGFARIAGRGQAQVAQWEKAQAPLEYLTDRAGWFERQSESEGGEAPVYYVPDLRPVPLSSLLNPSGEPVEPAGMSDSYLAEMFTQAAAGVLVLAGDSGCWLKNEGHVWREWGTKSDARAMAKSAVAAWARNLAYPEQVAEQAVAEANYRREEWNARRQAGLLTPDEISDPPSFDPDDERVKRLEKNRARLHSDTGTSAVASMVVAKAAECSDVLVAQLDAEAHVIWAGGVAWSLLHPELTVVPGASSVHLKSCAVSPRPGRHPLFDEALAALLPDKEVMEWALRELAGACLWGETSKEHPVLDGPPNAGKSTVTDTIRKILGGYAVDVDPDKLIGGRDSSSAEEEKAAMIVARMVLLDEPPKRDRQSISQFNRLASGTGEISASAKYKGRVSAPKRFNMVINQNPKQNRMKMDAEGVRQRLVFIPAEGHIPVELYRRFQSGVRAEYPAILATLIKECALFHTGHRLPVPLRAQMILDAAYDDADEFPQWVSEYYEIPADKPSGHDEDQMPGFDALRKAYAEHARSVPGAAPLSRSQLRERLEEMGIKVKEYGGSNGKRHNVVILRPLPAAQGTFR